MFNYTSDLIFRPKRTLLYVDVQGNDALMGSVMDGNVPEEFEKYNFEYGAYDYVGLFLSKNEGKGSIVVGIELFEDREYTLADGMKAKTLPESEMLKIEVDRAQIGSAKGIVDFIKAAKEAKPKLERDYSFSDDMQAGVFFDQKKIRVFLPIVSDYDADPIDKANLDKISKEELFNAAYVDKVTGLYTWNWLSARFRKNLLNKEGIKRYCFVHVCGLGAINSRDNWSR